jgi:hypothetical protein
MCVPLKVEENYSGGGFAETLPLDTHIRAIRIAQTSLEGPCSDGRKKALSVDENLKLKRLTGVRFQQERHWS